MRISKRNFTNISHYTSKGALSALQHTLYTVCAKSCYRRSLKNVNWTEFMNDLSNGPDLNMGGQISSGWYQGSDEMFQTTSAHIMKILDKHAPLNKRIV